MHFDSHSMIEWASRTLNYFFCKMYKKTSCSQMSRDLSGGMRTDTLQIQKLYA